MKRRRTSIAIVLIIVMLASIPIVVFASYGAIKIDGHYDDWEDKPHAEVYQGSNPKDKAINMVSLFRDDSNIYVHIIFSQQYSPGIKNMSVELVTNLGDGYFELRESGNYDLIGNIDNLRFKNSSKGGPAITDGGENGSSSGNDASAEAISSGEENLLIEDPNEEEIELDDWGEDTLIDQAEEGLRVFNVYQNDDLVGEGYMTIGNMKIVEAEFYIPLDTISAQPDGISEISMQIKKLGKQWIHSVGAGTNPFLGIAISIVLSICVVIIGFLKYRKKRAAL